MQTNNRLQHTWFLYAIVLVIAAIFLHQPEALLQNDLDSAVRWASAFLFDSRSSQHYLYPHTNGPLFFLKFPIPGGHCILLSVLFDFASKLILGFYILHLSLVYRPANHWLPILVFIGFCVFLPLDFIIIATALSCSLLSLQHSRFLTLLPGIALIVTSIFIKASISFPALFILGSTIVVLLFQKKKSLAFKMLGTFFLLLLLGTALLYDNLWGGLSWLAMAFIATLSYGNDQAIFFNNSIPLIALTVFFILVVPILVRKKSSLIFMLIIALATFAVWKYSLGRMDFTHYRAWYFLCMVLGSIFVITHHGRNAYVGAACFFLSLTSFSTNTQRGDSPKEISYTLPRVDILARQLIKHQTVNEDFHAQSMNQLTGAHLSDSILFEIGTSTVDVFPWGLALFYKYPQLHYQPRPGFHSTLLGSLADKKEAKYFASSAAPKNILWHDAEPALFALNAHDQVYLPNAVPQTFISLLTNYRLKRYEHGYALWQKSVKKQSSWSAEKSMKIKTNEWFTVPKADSSALLFGKLDIKLTSFEKLIRFVYKGPFFKMAYRLEDNQESWHFVSLESLQENILLQPYFTDPSLKHKTVKDIFIEPMQPKHQHCTYELRYQALYVP